MKLRSIIGVFISALILSACWIGDRDDFEVQYDSTLIEVLCQTPEARTFCTLINKTPTYQTGASAGAPIAAFVLGTSVIGGTDQGIRCAAGVETVFAPSDSAFGVWMQGFPQWSSVDDIPSDTAFMIVLHHIYRDKKLFVEIDNPVCTEEEIEPGTANDYKMWDGQVWNFAVNGAGQLAALSQSTFSTNIYSPDTSTTDGIVYIIDKVLGPF